MSVIILRSKITDKVEWTLLDVNVFKKVKNCDKIRKVEKRSGGDLNGRKISAH
jgi:hypothetical protein